MLKEKFGSQYFCFILLPVRTQDLSSFLLVYFYLKGSASVFSLFTVAVFYRLHICTLLSDAVVLSVPFKHLLFEHLRIRFAFREKKICFVRLHTFRNDWYSEHTGKVH